MRRSAVAPLIVTMVVGFPFALLALLWFVATVAAAINGMGDGGALLIGVIISLVLLLPAIGSVSWLVRAVRPSQAQPLG